MPIVIHGKVTDAEGNPIYQIAQISEVATILLINGILPVVGMNTWSNPETGDFEFIAMHPSSIIKIAAHGYKEVHFPVNVVPAVIKLEEAIVIEGKTKRNNKLLVVGIGIGLLAIAVVLANKAKKSSSKTTRGLATRKTIVI